MKLVYVDEEVVVYRGLTDVDVERAIARILSCAGKPTRVQEIARELKGVVSEERVRKALQRLVVKGIVKRVKKGRVTLYTIRELPTRK